MKGNKIKIIIGVAASLIFLLITVGNGCSKRSDLESNISSSTTGTSSSGSNNTPSDVIPGAKTASVVYAKQALDQLTSCAGVVSPSDETLRMYDSKSTSISAYGDAITVTAPMMMAIANISGEVCNDLINQEIAAGSNARIFVGWNLSANTLPDANSTANAISRMALSCWQGQPTMDEQNAILDLLATVKSGDAGASRKQAELLCTAVLSSLKSLLN
ncbi:MAG: hypothetical protein ACXWPX_10490 [Pseudobdellovibrio sp.]